MNDEECFHKLYWIIQSYSFSVRVSELLQQVHRHNFLKGNSHSITRHNLPSPNIKWPTTEKNRERKYTYFLPTSLLPKHFPFSIFIVFRGQFYASCWRFRPNCIFLSFPLAVLILSHKIISLKDDTRTLRRTLALRTTFVIHAQAMHKHTSRGTLYAPK